jgi:hypothetical protein
MMGGLVEVKVGEAENVDIVLKRLVEKAPAFCVLHGVYVESSSKSTWEDLLRDWQRNREHQDARSGPLPATFEAQFFGGRFELRRHELTIWRLSAGMEAWSACCALQRSSAGSDRRICWPEGRRRAGCPVMASASTGRYRGH